jgi:hypothetical protein
MTGTITLYKAPYDLIGVEGIVPGCAGLGLVAKVCADSSSRVLFACQGDPGTAVLFEAHVHPNSLAAVLAEVPGVTVALDDEGALTSPRAAL